MRRAVGAILAILVLIGGLSPPLSAQLLGLIQGITVIDSGTACVTAPTACATFDVGTSASFAFDVSGTWTGTLTFEGTTNGGVWRSVLATNPATGVAATSTTASGSFVVANSGFTQVRARATGAITGTANISGTRGYARATWPNFVNGSGVALGPILATDGTSTTGGYCFASETTLCFWRSAAGTFTAQGNFTSTGTVTAGIVTSNSVVNMLGATTLGEMRWSGKLLLRGNDADGWMTLTNNARTSGVTLKVDALPTISSGFGTSPSVVAGGTALNFVVNVGAGGTATTGIALFNGTPFPSTPGCTLGQSAGTTFTTYVATTAQITLTTATAWPASTLVTVQCISSK